MARPENVTRPQLRHVRRPALAPLAQTYGAAGVLGALLLYNALFTRNFLTTDTLNINLTQVATIVMVATGMTFVIATGGIDLSVGSLMAIAGALGPLILLGGGGHVAALVLPLLLAGSLGIFNGTLVAYFRIQPIIATLVLFIAGRGIAQVLTNGNLQTFDDRDFQYIGLGRPFGIPFQVIVMVVIVALAWWTMRSTSFGRYVLATGGNERAARLAGVPVMRVKLAVYAISGLLAGIAGLVVVAINSSSDAAVVGLNMELAAIAAVAVGGTPLTGGRATMIGTLLGALIMQLISFTLVSHGVKAEVAMVVQAAIILLAVHIQRRGDA